MNVAKFMPPEGSPVLERDRLISRLASWEARKLLLIHGPAGQGKSTLAAAYLRSAGSSSVWYALDAADEDPGALLACLGRAVQRSFPALLPDVPAPPRPRYGSWQPSQALAHWTHRVFGALPPVLIVLDDCPPLSPDAPLAQVILSLISTTPPQVRFLFISRTRPELDIARLRAKRGVGELGSEDLRFSDAEAGDLFGTVFGMPVTQREAGRINGLTEGWAAGLVLMHEYLASPEAALPGPELGSSGSPGFRDQVFDYLAQEVFNHLPQDLRDFLLRTSVADHLPGRLIGLLTGRGAAAMAALVRDLRQRNLFITVSEAEGGLVRYHALFRDFLLKQLWTGMPRSEAIRLHGVAARYFAEYGDPVRAAGLLLASGQFEKAARQIEQAGDGLIARGQTNALVRLLDGLPPAMQERPWRLFYRAVAWRFTDPPLALSLFHRSAEGFRSSGSAAGEIRALGGVIEACFHSGGDFIRMERAASRARELLRSGPRLARSDRARLLLALGTASCFTGRLDQGIEALQQARELFRSLQDPFHQVTCAVYLTPCSLYRGEFRRAQEAVRRGFEAQRSLPEEPGGEAALLLAQAMTELFLGNFGSAQASMDACLRLSQEHGLEAIRLLMLDIGGWIRLAQGDHLEAEQLLEECRQRGEETGRPFFSVSAAHLLSLVHLFQRRLGRARRASEYALADRPSGQSRLFRGIYLIVNGAISLEQDRPADAEQDLLQALRLLRQAGALQQEANAHLMLARLYGRTRRTRAELRHLREGFTIGQDRGFAYYALFTAEQLRRLAKRAADQGVCSEYCSALMTGDAAAAGQAVLRIHCFGGFRVERGRTPISEKEWKGKRSKMLVKLLAAHDGMQLTRDALVELLWPTQPAERHPALLSSLLHRVRRVMDAGGSAMRDGSCIIQEGGSLSLRRGWVWTDAGAFALEVGAARNLRTQGKLREALACYDRAFGLYGGELLPDDQFEDWTTRFREHFRRVHADALSDAAEITETLGDRKRSLALYERMFAVDQCHEKACRWLMARHASEGRRSEAVRIYERHELAVRKELDLDPDEQTRKLYRNIIGG